jgi:FtsP/CotA-like multicopper oxidase with cupredoxin domain
MRNLAHMSFICLLAAFQVTAQQDTIELHIRSGVTTLFDGTSVPAKAYTTSDNFVRNSDILALSEGQNVLFRVINDDVEEHGFTASGLITIASIAPTDTVDQEITLNTPGIFRYFDPVDSFRNTYLGLSGIIHIKETGDPASYFYWDLREISPVWNDELIVNNSVDPLTYSPEYFQINGNSSPDIDLDPLAKITGSVGEEIRVVIMNNGQSIHSIHFHGYHAEILIHSSNPEQQGRSKDTFPIYPSAHLLLSFTPDKPGLYPVHDHNLVAVTGGGIYHAGMFTTLEIAP